MITGINESIKQILCNCKCKLDGKKCDSDQWWNKDKCQCQCTKRHVCEKDYIHLHAVVKNKNIQQVLWMIKLLCVMKLYSHTIKKNKNPSNKFK